jgi:hypothetical protein
MSDSDTRHSFSLRNANSDETLFIGFAHRSGIDSAMSVAHSLEWKFDHSLAELLATVEELNATCRLRSS